MDKSTWHTCWYIKISRKKKIKEIRSRLTRHRISEKGISAIHVPIVSIILPNFDANLTSFEWATATKLAIGVGGKKVNFFLQSDGIYLYIGCGAIDERTKAGFGQCKFYYHLNMTGVIINERIQISTNRNDILGGLRSTSVRWLGPHSAIVDERWKEHPISEWRIVKHARGLSSFNSHRQYEAKLDLKEIGLSSDTPTPIFAEVESDSVYPENGKFDHRTYIGQLGSQDNPQWMIIDSKISTGQQLKDRSKPKVYKWIDKDNNAQFSGEPPPSERLKLELI